MSDAEHRIKLTFDFKKFRKGIENVDKNVGKLQTQFTNLGGAIGAAFIGSQIQNFVMEVTELALQSQNVEKAFLNIGDKDLLKKLREDTHGLVSDFQLMQSSVQASNFGIPIEKMGKLLEIASFQAQATGENVENLVSQIVVGLGRKSTQRLDDLGVTANELKEALGGVGVEAASTAELTQAFLDVSIPKMEKLGGITDNVATTVQQSKVQWENLKTEIGEGLLPVINIAIKGLKGLRMGFNWVTESVGKLVDKVEDFSIKLPKNIEFAKNVFTGFWNGVKDLYKGAKGEMPYGLFNKEGRVPIEKSKPRTGAELNAKFAKLEEQQVKKTAKAYADYLPKVKAVNLQSKEMSNFNAQVAAPQLTKYTDEINAQAVAMEVLSLRYERWIMQQQKINEQMMTWGNDIFGLINESFSAALINGENFFSVLGDAVVNFTKKLIAQLAALTAISAIMSAFGLGSFGSIFGAVAGGQGGVLGAIFGGGTSRVSAGGFGTVSNQALNFTARVSGQDLLLVTDRNQFTRSRNG